MFKYVADKLCLSIYRCECEVSGEGEADYSNATVAHLYSSVARRATLSLRFLTVLVVFLKLTVTVVHKKLKQKTMKKCTRNLILVIQWIKNLNRRKLNSEFSNEIRIKSLKVDPINGSKRHLRLNTRKLWLSEREDQVSRHSNLTNRVGGLYLLTFGILRLEVSKKNKRRFGLTNKRKENFSYFTNKDKKFPRLFYLILTK